MNSMTIQYQWEIFKTNFPKIDFHNDMMRLNGDFNLDPSFYQTDLDNMRERVMASLDAIKVIREELQK